MANVSSGENQTTHTRETWWDRRLWFEWVVANTLGELTGLGLAALLGIVLVLIVEGMFGGLAPILIALGMVALGTFEGAVVGAAQWIVLGRRVAEIRNRTWILATAFGAFIAWTLGMIPSTAVQLSGNNGESAGPEMNQLLFLGLAAALGATLGVILALPQWIVLRQHVRRSGVWIPANALAWMAGMPLIFLGASSVPDGAGTPVIVAIVLATVIVAGAVVGAVHGIALSWILHRDRISRIQQTSHRCGRAAMIQHFDRSLLHLTNTHDRVI